MNAFESFPDIVKPTIGIEIELPWPTMLRRVDEEAAAMLEASRGYHAMSVPEQARMDIGFQALDDAYKEKVEGVFGDDIFKGNDGFVEFAFRPKADHKELVDVARGLYDLDILREDETYPLHVTLGNIPLMRASWLALMSMEIAGGTTPERIAEQRTWDRRGQAGVLERKPYELTLGAVEGFEMRSLVVTELPALERTLYIAQAAGTVLLAKRRGDDAAWDLWQGLYGDMMDATQEQGVDATHQWPNPRESRTPWVKFATALEDEAWRARTTDMILEHI